MKYVKELYYNYNTDYLAKLAEKICLLNYGNRVFLRGLLEFSNECKMNCLYCGLRKDNKKINRYFIPPDKIIDIITKFYIYGFRSFVLQSGEFITYKIKDLCYIIKNIKKKFNDVAITLSCGYFNKNDLKILKENGVDRYLLRFETSDSKIYSFLKNGLSLKKRIEMLYNLKELNYETGSGFMVGLPYETDEIILNNIKLCYDLKLDMIGIGPFIPNPDTPLRNLLMPEFDKIVKITAILRIILPFSNIPATTASGTIEKSVSYTHLT
ncbi:MAG: radical SAM protein, partial [Candidatus Goldbacteria bacterium]|nr:radical SAM protein [Candidatus Goldiibacteriota bacterium]